jgi:hypothetical protein
VDEYHGVDIYAGAYVSKRDLDVRGPYRDVVPRFDQWVVEAREAPRG